MRLHPRSPRLERLEDRRLLATLTVDSADEISGDTVFTLRQAISVVDGTIPLSSLSSQQRAQISGSLSAPDTIAFDIPGAGVHTIEPIGALPTITVPVTIDGYTQPGSSPNTLAVGDNAKILIELDGEFAGLVNGLVFTGGHSAVEGLAINRFGTRPQLIGVAGDVTAHEPLEVGSRPIGGTGGVGLLFENNSGGNVVWGDFIGTDPTGTIGEPNAKYGVVFSGDASPDSLGGTQPAARNVVQVGDVGTVQQYGVEIDHENNPYILNNYLGTDAAGTGVPTGQGVANATALTLINVNGAHVGGAVSGAGNVIQGMRIGSDPGTFSDGYDRIYGNLIGTDATGTHAIGGGPGYGGVAIDDSAGNVIGGSSPGMGNVIAAPGGDAVDLTETDLNYPLGGVVEGDHIGTDLTGAVNFGDVNGVVILSSHNAVGDVVPGSGNVIAFSQADGVTIRDSTSTDVLLAGTLVPGPVSTGNKILANSIYGNGGLGISLPLGSPPGTPEFGTAEAVSIGSAHAVNTGLLVQGGTFTGVTKFSLYLFDHSYTVEFFANPAGTSQGRTYLGRITVTADTPGAQTFSTLLPVAVGLGEVVTATVTDEDGNTTKFSPGATVAPPPGESMSFSASPSSAALGTPLTLTATVTPSDPGLGLPTGAVIFKDGKTVLAVVKVDGSGKASFTTSALGRGAHRLYAIYDGDPVFFGVKAPPIDVSVA